MGILLLFAALLVQAPAAPDYAAVYARGVPFEQFLDRARSRAEDWRSTYRNAHVSDDVGARMRALPEPRRVLVVAEDWCSDSLQSVPFIAKLVESAEGRLEMRVVNAKTGRLVMEAHRTPDDRAATPTVVVLAADGRLTGSWTERPSELQARTIEQKKTMMQKKVHELMLAWYEQDAGRSTVLEIAALVSR